MSLLAGHTAQSQTTDSREVQLKKGLEKLKICKQKVKNCVKRGVGNEDISCRDNFESCFERVSTNIRRSNSTSKGEWALYRNAKSQKKTATAMRSLHGGRYPSFCPCVMLRPNHVRGRAPSPDAHVKYGK